VELGYAAPRPALSDGLEPPPTPGVARLVVSFPAIQLSVQIQTRPPRCGQRRTGRCGQASGAAMSLGRAALIHPFSPPLTPFLHITSITCCRSVAFLHLHIFTSYKDTNATGLLLNCAVNRSSANE